MIGNVRFGGFTIKAVNVKRNREIKRCTKMLYCVANFKDDKWFAEVNTRGLKGYENKTIISFSDKSFDLQGKTEIFLHKKDEFGHYVRISRTKYEADNYPGFPEVYTPLRVDGVYSGYITKDKGMSYFDIKDYIGSKNNNLELLTKNNSNEDNIDEE